tara:strand:- start:104 stop:778 length:675 start_codon:yes stop_codon:yes gene_type:complete
MQLEYNVQELKHKLQKFLIEDRKKYDRTVEESSAKESKELYLEDIERKQGIIEDWWESVGESELLKSLTKVEPKSRIKEGWFFDTEVIEDKLVLRDITEFHVLPEGFHWKIDYLPDYLYEACCRIPYKVYQPITEIPINTKVFKKFSVKTVALRNGYTNKYCSHLSYTDVFEIYATTLPYLEISSYEEPANVGKLLDKILLAEKHGCVTVVLEDKDLDVLMNIE